MTVRGTVRAAEPTAVFSPQRKYKISGSSPAPATNEKPLNQAICAKLGGFLYALKQANNSTIIQNYAFLRNISESISAFFLSASSTI